MHFSRPSLLIRVQPTGEAIIAGKVLTLKTGELVYVSASRVRVFPDQTA